MFLALCVLIARISLLSLDTGASLTFMEEKILSRLGLCSDDLVSFSSVVFRV